MPKNLVRVGLAVSALALVLATSACGSDDKTASAGSAPSTTTSAAPSMDAAAAGLVGPGCADYAKANPSGAVRSTAWPPRRWPPPRPATRC